MLNELYIKKLIMFITLEFQIEPSDKAYEANYHIKTNVSETLKGVSFKRKERSNL